MNCVVYNNCYGGFSLSGEGIELFNELSGEVWTNDIPRHHPALIKVVEQVGESAAGKFSDLQIVQIPGLQYNINEYDGDETVEVPENKTWIKVSNEYSREKWPEYFL